MTAQPETRHGLRIEHPGLLLVEGPDDYHFFRQIVEHRDLGEMEIIPYDGKDNLGSFLTGVLIPRLRSASVVKAIGVTRDADDDFDRAFQSIGDSLRRAGLPVPSTPLTLAEGSLYGDAVWVAAYVMPDNASPGDLETLCLNAVSQSPAMPCVDRYFSCLQEIGLLPGQESKARLRAFLSANPDNPNLLTGQAIAAGVIPWDSPAFGGIHQLLDMLAEVD